MKLDGVLELKAFSLLEGVVVVAGEDFEGGDDDDSDGLREEAKGRKDRRLPVKRWWIGDDTESGIEEIDVKRAIDGKKKLFICNCILTERCCGG